MAITSEQFLLMKAELQGGAKVTAEIEAMTGATNQLTRATNRQSAAAAAATRRTFIQQQAVFTARRGLFYFTLAAVGATAAVGALGLSYFNAMQQTEVALGQVIPKGRQLNKVMHDLFIMAATTPFQVKDVALQFKALFIPMSKFGYSAQYVNDLLLGMMNSLSVVGKLTGAALQRASVQIIHMVTMGRPMGQVLQALARDNIPVYQALEKYLGLTEKQLRSVSAAGVTTRQVLDALKKYQLTEKGYANQAFLSQTKTLVGAFSTMKDFLSQAGAGTGGNIFGGLQKRLQAVDKALLVMSEHGKTITMTDVVEQLDKQFSARTHIIINLFELFRAVITTVIGSIYAFGKAIQFVLARSGLDALFGWFHLGRHAARALGIALGFLASMWLLQKVRMVVVAFWQEILIARTYAQKRATAAGAAMELLGNRILLAKARILKTVASAQALWTVAMGGSIRGANGKFRAMTRLEKLMMRFRRTIIALIPVMIEFAATAYANPYVWIAVAVIALVASLVILYIKWKAFHDLVDRTFNWIKDHKWVLLFLGPFIASIYSTIKIAEILYKTFKRIYDLLSHPLDLKLKTSGGGWHILKGFTSFVMNPAGFALRASGLPGTKYLKYTDPTHYLPSGQKHAWGGTQRFTGPALVGERGPEIVSLPMGARITPLPVSGYGGIGQSIINLRGVVRVQGRDIGEIVASNRLDIEARR